MEWKLVKIKFTLMHIINICVLVDGSSMFISCSLMIWWMWMCLCAIHYANHMLYFVTMRLDNIYTCMYMYTVECFSVVYSVCSALLVSKCQNEIICGIFMSPLCLASWFAKYIYTSQNRNNIANTLIKSKIALNKCIIVFEI